MIDIAWLATTGPCKKFVAGHRIPCPGGPDPAERAMYILLAGRVDVYKASAAGGTQTAGSLLPGDVMGGREFFTEVEDYIYTAGIDSVVYVITESSFNDLSWSRPDILFEVFRGAYMPLRKMTASQKTALTKAATEATAEQKTADAPEEAAKTKKAATTAVTSTATSKEVAEECAKQTLIAAEWGGIYPEGHKYYQGITRPEYANLVFPKEYECPCCKKPFTDYRVFRSKLFESKPMRFDLRRFYTGFMTEWYDVITCHNCLFSTFHNYFTEPKPIQKAKFENELTAARSAIHMDFSAARDIDFVFTMYYLAMVCSEGYLSVGRQIRAKLWGNLSWLYEDVEDDEMSKYCAEKAAAAYEAVYTESRLTPTQEQITCLSIAGMQHRAGIDRNLKKFLFTAKTIKMGDKTYARLAEDFMFDIRASESS